MTIKPIRNETDYDAALAEIDLLMGVAPETPESDRLEVLVTLVGPSTRCQVPNAS